MGRGGGGGGRRGWGRGEGGRRKRIETNFCYPHSAPRLRLRPRRQAFVFGLLSACILFFLYIKQVLRGEGKTLNGSKY